MPFGITSIINVCREGFALIMGRGPHMLTAVQAVPVGEIDKILAVLEKMLEESREEAGERRDAQDTLANEGEDDEEIGDKEQDIEDMDGMRDIAEEWILV